MRVVVEDRSGYLGYGAHLVRLETLDAAEVDEADGAVGVEQAVTGVGIRVEHPEAPQAAYSEADNDLAPAIAEGLLGEEGIGPAHPSTRFWVSTRRVDSSATTSGTWMNGCPR